MKRYLLPFFITVSSTVFAQYATDLNALGDKAFQDKAYYEAAYYYRKSAERLNLVPGSQVPYQSSPAKKATQVKEADRMQLCYRLAESCRLYENYLEAEGWYYKVSTSAEASNYPLVHLWYGTCLRANGHFAEAEKQLTEFLKGPAGDNTLRSLAEREITNCRFALEQLRFPSLANLAKLGAPMNTNGSNYAIALAADRLYFTSSRSIEGDKKHLNKLYSTATAGNEQAPVMLKLNDPDPKPDAEYGTPSFDYARHRIYLTKWYKEGKKEIHVIYRGDQAGDKWNLVKLNGHVNVAGFNAIQPFVTAGGAAIYFASDKPGGLGGYDIWCSKLDNEGNALNSVNLGNTINTSADEQAPRVDEREQKLTYSSKGFTGIGGFDVVESVQRNGQWSTPVNLGYPVNSSKDDLYYLPYQETAKSVKFYISSDRESDCCLELYSGTRRSVTLAGQVLNCTDNGPLEQVVIRLRDSISGTLLGEITTGKDGAFGFPVNTSRPMILAAEKKGYFSKTLQVALPGNFSRDTLSSAVCMQPFLVGKPVTLKNILYDFGSASLRNESKTELDALVAILKDNPAFKIELSANTDSVGSDAYNLKLSLERAQSCVHYIVSRGINESRILAKGYGETRPVAPNSLPGGADNPEGRQRNRRTEFTVLKTQ